MKKYLEWWKTKKALMFLTGLCVLGNIISGNVAIAAAILIAVLLITLVETLP